MLAFGNRDDRGFKRLRGLKSEAFDDGRRQRADPEFGLVRQTDPAFLPQILLRKAFKKSVEPSMQQSLKILWYTPVQAMSRTLTLSLKAIFAFIMPETSVPNATLALSRLHYQDWTLPNTLPLRFLNRQVTKRFASTIFERNVAMLAVNHQHCMIQTSNNCDVKGS